MRLILAVLQRAVMPAGAAGEIQHRRHAADRPKRAKKAMTAPAPVGSMMPTDFARAWCPSSAHGRARASPHDLVIGEDAFVAVHDGDGSAAEFRARIQQRLKHRLRRPHNIERYDVFAGRGGDAGEGQGAVPDVAEVWPYPKVNPFPAAGESARASPFVSLDNSDSAIFANCLHLAYMGMTGSLAMFPRWLRFHADRRGR